MSSTSAAPTKGPTKVSVSRLEAKTVYVKGLDHEVVTTVDIRDWLGQLGPIDSVAQELEAATMKPRFKVVFMGVECAEQAVKSLNGVVFKNKVATIVSTIFGNFAQNKNQEQSSNGDASASAADVVDPQWEYVCTDLLPHNRGVPLTGFKGRQLYAHMPHELQFSGPIVPFAASICTRAGVKRARDEDESAAANTEVVAEGEKVGGDAQKQDDDHVSKETTPEDVKAAVRTLRRAQSSLVSLEEKRVLLQERFAHTPLGRVETKAKQTRQREAVVRTIHRHIYETVRVDACVEVLQYERYVGEGGVERIMLLIAKAIGPVAGAYVTYGPDRTRPQSLVIEMAHVVDARVLVGLGAKATTLVSVYSSFHKQVAARKEAASTAENPLLNTIIETCLWPTEGGANNGNPNNSSSGNNVVATYDPHYDYNLLCHCPNEETYMRHYQLPVLPGGILAAAAPATIASTTSTNGREAPAAKIKTLKESMLATMYQSGVLDSLLEGSGGGYRHNGDGDDDNEDGEEDGLVQQIVSILKELRKVPFSPLTHSLSNGDSGAWGCNPSAATASGGFVSLVSKAYDADQTNYWSKTTARSVGSAVQAMLAILNTTAVVAPAASS